MPEVEVDTLERHYAASDLERLRLKDFAELTPDERRAVQRLIAEQPVVLPPRRTRRSRADSRRGQLDLGATLRRSLRRGGEPSSSSTAAAASATGRWWCCATSAARWRPTPGSSCLRLHPAERHTDRLEVFVFATRLTRITRELERRDVDLALRSASSRIADWGGGTRIGESLKKFNFDWARRLLGRGAWVIVLSDGWDRGDRDLLAREMARLRRSCSRLIWLNPLLGSAGYQPVAGGIRAVLPYVDDFLPVHNLRSLEQLAESPAGGRPCSRRRHPEKRDAAGDSRARSRRPPRVLTRGRLSRPAR